MKSEAEPTVRTKIVSCFTNRSEIIEKSIFIRSYTFRRIHGRKVINCTLFLMFISIRSHKMPCSAQDNNFDNASVIFSFPLETIVNFS